MVADQLVRGSPRGARAAVIRCCLCGLSASLAACILLFFGAPAITTACFHGKISPLPLQVLALSLPFMALAAAISGYFTAVRRVVKSASAQMLEQFVHMGTAILLLTWVAPAGIEPACLCLVIGGALSEVFCSCLYLFVLYRLDLAPPAGWQRPQLGHHGAHLVHLPACGVQLWLIRSGVNTIKQVMVPLGLEKHGLSCDLAIAQYGAVRGMVMPILQFPSALLASFSSLLIPEIAENHVQGRKGHIDYMIGRIFKTSLLFSVGVAGILYTYADELSFVIYQDISVAPFLRLLAPLVVMMYLDDMVDAILKGLDRQTPLAGINILESVLSVVFLQLFLPWLGIYGYLFSLFFSELLNGSLGLPLPVPHHPLPPALVPLAGPARPLHGAGLPGGPPAGARPGRGHPVHPELLSAAVVCPGPGDPAGPLPMTCAPQKDPAGLPALRGLLPPVTASSVRPVPLG